MQRWETVERVQCRAKTVKGNGKDKTSPFMIPERIFNPGKMLHEMNTLSSDVEQLVQTFIQTRLHATHARQDTGCCRARNPKRIYSLHWPRPCARLIWELSGPQIRAQVGIGGFCDCTCSAPRHIIVTARAET